MMQAHGKLANTRADAFKRFMDDLRAAATTALPQWTMIQEEIIAPAIAGETVIADPLIEHVVLSIAVARRLWKVEGVSGGT